MCTCSVGMGRRKCESKSTNFVKGERKERERERQREREREREREKGEGGKLVLEMRGIAGDLTTFNPINWNV